MQHLMGRRATAQGEPVHCCIDLMRYEYRYNRGAAGKEAFFPDCPAPSDKKVVKPPSYLGCVFSMAAYPPTQAWMI